MWLEQIRETNDIKKLPEEALPVLAQEIRSFLVEHLSVTGGHLGSNLGAVELTIALHRTLDLPDDKIIWDVGHQSYTHKILTGRKEGFDKLRQTGGLSGFPKKSESDTDVFETGHAVTRFKRAQSKVRRVDIHSNIYYLIHNDLHLMFAVNPYLFTNIYSLHGKSTFLHSFVEVVSYCLLNTCCVCFI